MFGLGYTPTLGMTQCSEKHLREVFYALS